MGDILLTIRSLQFTFRPLVQFGLVLLVGAVVMGACVSPKATGCQRFKTGTFRYHYRGPQGDFWFVFARTDSLQTETSPQTGISTMAIRWTSPCTYELRWLRSNRPLPDSVSALKRSMVLKNEILGETDTYYLVQSTLERTDYVLRDTVWLQR